MFASLAAEADVPAVGSDKKLPASYSSPLAAVDSLRGSWSADSVILYICMYIHILYYVYVYTPAARSIPPKEFC